MYPTHKDGVAVPGSNTASAADQAPGEDLETPSSPTARLRPTTGPGRNPSVLVSARRGHLTWVLLRHAESRNEGAAPPRLGRLVVARVRAAVSAPKTDPIVLLTECIPTALRQRTGITRAL